jgi:hypothetical protein
MIRRSKRSGPKISFEEEVRAVKSGFQEVSHPASAMRVLVVDDALIRCCFGTFGTLQIARELQQMHTELQARINAMGELTRTVRPHSLTCVARLMTLLTVDNCSINAEQVEQTLAQPEHKPAERGAAPSGPTTTLDVLHSHFQRS